MIYYIQEALPKERIEEGQKNAVRKARSDVGDILEMLNYKPIVISVNRQNRINVGILRKLYYHYRVYRNWTKKTKRLKNGDTLILQYPIVDHTVLCGVFGRRLKKRGVRIVLLVHDLSLLRDLSKDKKSNIRVILEERKLLDLADRIIVHNSKMKARLKKMINPERMIPLEIFDYLIPEYENNLTKERGKDLPIAIAGNLKKEKAGYIYRLPAETSFNLYGTGYISKNKDNISYMGSFLPEDLPFQLDGSFGLVWDGAESETCTGLYGNYLRYNNPHKTSLYLASDMPVIIWSKAALADFVVKNKIGITVDSLDDIKNTIESLSEKNYSEMLDNVKVMGERLRGGELTKRALEKAIKDLCGERYEYKEKIQRKSTH